MNVKALSDVCDKLVANDATLNTLRIHLDYVDDADLKQILDAAKKNKTVKRVYVDGGGIKRSLRHVPLTLSLASVVSEHPKIQEIEFSYLGGIEYGPIALAIQLNHNVTCLKFYECEVTPNLVEYIRWLLTENALESLAIIDIISEERESLDISGALLGNSSLRELVLSDDYGVFGWETFQAIPLMIRTKQYFERIDLSLWQSMTGRFELVRLISQAAEGHASLNKLAIGFEGYDFEPSTENVINHVGSAEAIGTLLHNAPALRDLYLTKFDMGSSGARHLADGLSSKNSVVEKLDLPWNKLRSEEAGIFARVLLANQSLKWLVLDHNNIGDFGALELAVALGQNNTLEYLNLSSNRIGSDGASALADALVTNDALNDLDLCGNSIGDDGATSIAEMLTRNEIIEKVGIGGFGEEGLRAFVTRVPEMSHVKTIKFNSVEGFTSETGNALVQALEQNTTVERFYFAHRSPPWNKVMPQVERLLALNRGGRRLLSVTGESVPPVNYWPRILARSSTDRIHNADVLFFFLREIPNVLMSRAGSRKRKRVDDDDSTSSTVHHI